MDASETDNIPYVFTIGECEYTLKKSELPPYLESLVAFKSSSRNDNDSGDDKSQRFALDDPIAELEAALAGIQDGYRSIFPLLKTDAVRYQTLCATYDFLLVDVASELPIANLVEELKYTRQYGGDEGRGSLAQSRDAAFKLIYIVLTTETQEVKDLNRIYDAVLYVVSHPRTFTLDMRTVVLEAYLDRFPTSRKQRDNLETWSNKFATDFADSEDEDYFAMSYDPYAYDSDFD